MTVTELYASPLVGLTGLSVAVRVAKVILLERPCLYCTGNDSASQLANLADFESCLVLSRLTPSLDQKSKKTRVQIFSLSLYSRKSLQFETVDDDDMFHTIVTSILWRELYLAST